MTQSLQQPLSLQWISLKNWTKTESTQVRPIRVSTCRLEKLPPRGCLTTTSQHSSFDERSTVRSTVFVHDCKRWSQATRWNCRESSLQNSHIYQTYVEFCSILLGVLLSSGSSKHTWQRHVRRLCIFWLYCSSDEFSWEPSNWNDPQPQQRNIYLFATSVPIQESDKDLVSASRMTTLI